MQHWYFRIIDNAGIGHSQNVDLENDTYAIRKAIELLLEHCYLEGSYRIEYEFDFDGQLEIRLLDDQGKVMANGYAEEIEYNETDRFKRLKEIIRDKRMLPPDQVDLAQKEGYDLEEIAIAAIEEIE